MSQTNAANKKTLGIVGEEAAVEYLAGQGYKIKYLNYRFGRLGEIDIIACDKNHVCFIEVKTRTNNLYGLPSESVTKKKQENIKKLASIFLQRYNLFDADVRFDIVEVTAEKHTDKLSVKYIKLIKDAF